MKNEIDKVTIDWNDGEVSFVFKDSRETFVPSEFKSGEPTRTRLDQLSGMLYAIWKGVAFCEDKK